MGVDSVTTGWWDFQQVSDCNLMYTNISVSCQIFSGVNPLRLTAMSESCRII